MRSMRPRNQHLGSCSIYLLLRESSAGVGCASNYLPQGCGLPGPVVDSALVCSDVVVQVGSRRGHEYLNMSISLA
jgi:hypothetical protein